MKQEQIDRINALYRKSQAEGKKILKEMECCNIEIPELLRSVL